MLLGIRLGMLDISPEGIASQLLLREASPCDVPEPFLSISSDNYLLFSSKIALLLRDGFKKAVWGC